ncbi:beta-N-acetylglucosaminidase [Peribacillus deserti]|uniref:Beta-N-acetylglucosaminidase n=1 Tax=Peribacillus deserti TaxID=673318 RepID=A0ABS2QCG9_9BACI|nr:PA14 domain-containing protein [Peribacillus deserti]MBM7690858.1 beta-N-acetylglucosaminidase [Peribacillus deserti]
MAIKLKLLFASIITMSLAIFLSTFALVSNASASESTWSATYYPRVDFKGTAVNATVSQLNYNWGANSPNTKIPKDNFSAVYSKKITLSKAAKYRISGKADDGLQIFVNGVKQVDYWKDGSHYFNKELTLKSGTNTVQVKYYERGSNAYVQVNIQPIEDLRTDKWIAHFYPKINFTGTPAKQYYTDLKSVWSGSPASGIPADNFSATFERKMVIPKTNKYKFSGRVDDGVRIYVDGVKQIEYWKDGVSSFNKEISLSAGTHTIKVEYYERGSKASLDLNIVPVQIQPAIPSDKWLATYYPKINFSGTPVNQYYSDLELVWSGSPAAGIPADNFSAKFERKMAVSKTGKYKFSGRVDDGFRIYVDGVKQIEYWKDGVSSFNKDISLSAGTHTIKVEYYERGSKASLDLNIVPVQVQPAIPSDKWLATYYPKVNFSGTPVYQYPNDLELVWSGSPAAGIPADNFSAKFERKMAVSKTGKYKFSGRVDDGVRIYVDGVKHIEYWKDGVSSFNKEISLSAGTHTIKVEYYERGSKASIDLNIEPVQIKPAIPSDKWLATYYPNINFTGTPVYQYPNDLELVWSGSPAAGIPADNFSATFERKMAVSNTGKYKFSGRVDDGVRIYVDGVKHIEYWKDGVSSFNKDISLSAGTHTIKVEYYERGSKASIDLNIEPIIATDQWTTAYYPNVNFTGTPVSGTADTLNFQWGAGSPHASIPSDSFSAKFTKNVSIPTAGKYKLSGQADDGIRVLIDGAVKVDNPAEGLKNFNVNVDLPAGVHTIEVEYYESSGNAILEVNLDRVEITKSIQSTNYSYTLQSAVDKQVKYASPQTDLKYKAYISADAFSSVTTAGTVTTGTVKSGTNDPATWNVRSGPGTDYWAWGSLSKGKKVPVVSQKLTAADGSYWYEISYSTTWKKANPLDVKYYIDPNSFKSDSQTFYQFLKLSGSAGTNAYEVNDRILTSEKAGVLSGKAQVYKKASQDYNINEVYLISHSLLETGNGKSQLSSGVKVRYSVDENGQRIYKDGKPQVSVVKDLGTYDAVVYNMYGIGAYDDCALECGAQRAFDEGWFTVDAAIIGGAKFVAENYVSKGQDTLYKMRWNPAALMVTADAKPTHQYATDIGWASKQTTRFYELYSTLESYSAIYDVPEYSI